MSVHRHTKTVRSEKSWRGGDFGLRSEQKRSRSQWQSWSGSSLRAAAGTVHNGWQRNETFALPTNRPRNKAGSSDMTKWGQQEQRRQAELPHCGEVDLGGA